MSFCLFSHCQITESYFAIILTCIPLYPDRRTEQANRCLSRTIRRRRLRWISCDRRAYLPWGPGAPFANAQYFQ
jgi:hypothetical protein